MNQDLAASVDPFFFRLRTNDAELRCGDLTTDWDTTLRFTNRTGNATGWRGQVRKDEYDWTGYVYPERWQRHQERLPGKGTSGLYFLTNRPIVPGSESIWLLTVIPDDPTTPVDETLEVSRRRLTRSVDYEINTTLGTIIFEKPIPSHDRDLRELWLEVTYAVPGGPGQGYVYGSRLELTSAPWTLGLTSVGKESLLSSEPQVSGWDLNLR